MLEDITHTHTGSSQHLETVWRKTSYFHASDGFTKWKMTRPPSHQLYYADKIGNEKLCGRKSHWRHVITHLLHAHVTNAVIYTVQATLMSQFLLCMVVQCWVQHNVISEQSAAFTAASACMWVAVALTSSVWTDFTVNASLHWQFSFTLRLVVKQYMAQFGWVGQKAQWSLDTKGMQRIHLIWINPLSGFDP